MGVISSTLRKREDRKYDEISEDALPAGENELLFQGFEWHVPADQQHWNRLRESLPRLKAMGVTSIWIPPACKAMSPQGNGYDIYDLYDVGEFDQKGSRATKWGTREELKAFIAAATSLQIGIHWDAVLNHKAAADFTEKVKAVKVEPGNRNLEIGKPIRIEAWTGYEFPGRGNKYSSLKYRSQHFSGIDWDQKTQQSGVYKFIANKKDWAKDVSPENGNYDYLMFADVDFKNAEVRQDVKAWVRWVGTEFNISGMRFDAAKHYSRAFLRELIRQTRMTVGADWFFVAEYWKGDIEVLLNYLKLMDNLVSLYDVPLAENFSTLSRKEGADLRAVFKGTLAHLRPQHAVTFVTNHDTQPGQSLEIVMNAWFKPLAYALIFLRQEGYPCLFYGDLYGVDNCSAKEKMPAVPHLSSLALARKLYAYGKQRDYFDKRDCIGFVRYGNSKHRDGLACILSSGPATSKMMYVGKAHTGEKWTEVYGSCGNAVIIDNDGYGKFDVGQKSVSIWVNDAAGGRDEFSRI